MGKAPKDTKTPRAHNKHLSCRVSFLYNAASSTYMQKAVAQDQNQNPQAECGTGPGNCKCYAESNSIQDTSENKEVGHGRLAHRLSSHIRKVALKGQLRLGTDVKRNLCKRCDMILIPGRTSRETVENKSRGGRKPWADVLVIECITCSGVKRYPIGATRQQRKTARAANKRTEPSHNTREIQQVPFESSSITIRGLGADTVST
jgi:ribonuclease P protein subunit RPR2